MSNCKKTTAISTVSNRKKHNNIYRVKPQKTQQYLPCQTAKKHNNLYPVNQQTNTSISTVSNDKTNTPISTVSNSKQTHQYLPCQTTKPTHQSLPCPTANKHTNLYRVKRQTNTPISTMSNGKIQISTMSNRNQKQKHITSATSGNILGTKCDKLKLATQTSRLDIYSRVAMQYCTVCVQLRSHIRSQKPCF